MGAGYRINAKAADTAEILIYEDVGESWMGGVTARQFATDLKGLGKVRTIDLRLNSNGGDVFDGVTIYRQLVEHPARVTTYIDGIAASIASVIAMAGQEILISEVGFLMIHDAWGMGIGNAADLRKLAGVLETVSDTLSDVYTARTGQPADKVKGWMAAETWFTGEEAVTNGFANKLMPNMALAAHVDPGRYKYRRVPNALAGRPAFDAARHRVERIKSRIEQHEIAD